MKHVLYDSDLIGDDLITLIAFSQFSEEMRLHAVTSYGRRIGALRRSQIARAILDALGVDGVDIVPGSDRPLLRDPIPGCRFCDFAIERFMQSRWENPDSKNPVTQGFSAAEYLVRTARESPGKYSLLCTGPLTNIALALSLDPDFGKNLREVVVMGGLWKVCGNSSASAEANMYNDPEAARIVFDRMRGITVVGLDVTLQVIIRKEHVLDTGSSEVGMMVRDIVEACCEAHKSREEGAVMPLHDLLALYVLHDPLIVKTLPCSIYVETRSSQSSGMTVCDFIDTRMAHKFAVEVNTERSLSLFQSLVKKIRLMERGR